MEDPTPLNLGGVQPGVPVPGFICLMLYPNQAHFGIALSILGGQCLCISGCT